jgi:hypothetical protein
MATSGLKTHCIPPTHRRLHLKQLKFKVTTKQFRFKTFTGNDFYRKKEILANGKLKKSCFDLWFDSALLLKDINGKGLDLFNEDLDYAKKLKVTTFPTILFSIDNEIKHP